MADTTISINVHNGNGERDKLQERNKALYWENVSLRHEVEFLQLLNAERKLKAKRMGMEAHYYRKLYKVERYKEIQRKAQREKAAEKPAEQDGGTS